MVIGSRNQPLSFVGSAHHVPPVTPHFPRAPLFPIWRTKTPLQIGRQRLVDSRNAVGFGMALWFCYLPLLLWLLCTDRKPAERQARAGASRTGRRFHGHVRRDASSSVAVLGLLIDALPRFPTPRRSPLESADQRHSRRKVPEARGNHCRAGKLHAKAPRAWIPSGPCISSIRTSSRLQVFG